MRWLRCSVAVDLEEGETDRDRMDVGGLRGGEPGASLAPLHPPTIYP